jgi:hypothetical protein
VLAVPFFGDASGHHCHDPLIACGPNRPPGSEIGVIAATGLEQPANSPETPSIPAADGADSGALGDGSNNSQFPDSDLARLIDAWPHLSPSARGTILALIESADKGVE